MKQKQAKAASHAVSYNPLIRRIALTVAALSLLLALSDAVMSRAAELPSSRSGVVTLLLVGTDRRSAEESGRTDTIMLVVMNENAGTLSLISLLRDLYVDIPGEGKNRLNAAYSIGSAKADLYGGGIQLLQSTIEANLGVTVDGYLEVDFSSVKAIVDAMGGVDVTLSTDEAAYLQGGGKNNKDGKAAYYTSGRTYEVTAGKNHLMGEAALDFMRARHVDAHNDFGRTDRQRRLLTALVKSASRDVMGALPAVQEGLHLIQTGSCTTDLSLPQVLGRALSGLVILSNERTITVSTIPQEDRYRDVTTSSGMSVVEPDSWSDTQAALQRMLQ